MYKPINCPHYGKIILEYVLNVESKRPPMITNATVIAKATNPAFVSDTHVKPLN